MTASRGLRTPALILAAVSKRGRALRHVAAQK
jgi:lambda repressor-like predicted transcriptional regulator